MYLLCLLGWEGDGRGEGGALKDWLYLRAVPARAPELFLKENRELNSELSPGLQVGGLVYKTLQVCISTLGACMKEGNGDKGCPLWAPWALCNIELSLA